MTHYVLPSESDTWFSLWILILTKIRGWAAIDVKNQISIGSIPGSNFDLTEKHHSVFSVLSVCVIQTTVLNVGTKIQPT